MQKDKRYAAETHLVYGESQTPKWDYAHHVVPPISSSTTFRLDSAQRGAQGFQELSEMTKFTPDHRPIYIYDRLSEPNKELLEENLAFAENGEMALVFSCGMSAISAALGSLTQSGQEIIAHKTLYGCTYSLLTNWYPRYNIATHFVDLKTPEVIRVHANANTRVIYFETPTNPSLELIDIAEVRKVVDELNKGRTDAQKIFIVIDNTFATPFCQRPLTLGSDFVVHALTKNIGGFGTDMGGVVIGPKWAKPLVFLYRKDFGGILSPKSAWAILVYGIPTLPLRMRQEMSTAMQLAVFLDTHPKIEEVIYPGLDTHPQHDLAKRQMKDYDGNFAPGSLIYFKVKGETPQESRDNGERLINYLAEHAYTITLAVSLGHTRTLIEHPSSMTHSPIPIAEQIKMGIDPGGIRISVGIEPARDIIFDLGEALKKI